MYISASLDSTIYLSEVWHRVDTIFGEGTGSAYMYTPDPTQEDWILYGVLQTGSLKTKNRPYL